MKRIAIAVLFMATSALAARDPAKYDRVLLPFAGTTGGFSGSWTAQWWFHNDGEAPVDVFPLAATCGLCPFFNILGAIAPGETPTYYPSDVAPPGPLVTVFIPVAATPPGALLYVERGKADHLAITGLLGRSTLAASRRSVSSALRAVPESRFRRGRQSIFVPLMADMRYTLRVYGLPESVNDPAVTVRSFVVREIELPQPPPETPFATATVKLVIPDIQDIGRGCIPNCDLPRVAYKPAVAELALSTPALSPGPLLRIEIEPGSPNVRWWAVISATAATDDVQFFETSDF